MSKWYLLTVKSVVGLVRNGGWLYTGQSVVRKPIEKDAKTIWKQR